MQKRTLKKSVLALFMVLLLTLSGCTQTQNNTVEMTGRYIAVVCKGSQHEFWKSVEQGARDAGEELGIRITFEAPEDESQIDVQMELMEKAIEQNADAIVLAPLDTERLNPLIEKANQKKIPVITLDSDVTSPLREATIGTDNTSAGSIAARNAMSLIGEKGQIAVISYVEGAQTAIERNAGFLNEIEANNQKHNMEVVDLQFSGGDADKSYEIAKKYIETYPDLRCIYAANEGCAVGTARAVEELGKTGKIVVIGFDSSDQEIDYLDRGVIQGMMVQNPYNMGYLGVRNINKVLDGKSIEEKIDTGATYVDGNNLKDEDTQWLLYPLGKNEK